MSENELEEVQSNMKKLAIELRGQFIHAFTYIEILVDDILRVNGIRPPEGKYFPMKEKMKHFRRCLRQYERKTGIKTKYIQHGLKDVIEMRHAMAHRFMDVSDEAVIHFDINRELKFITLKNGKEDEVYKVTRGIADAIADKMNLYNATIVVMYFRTVGTSAPASA